MRTDYKDDTFEGNRKYNMISNPDGSVSLVDVTAYTATGDVIGAAELNDIAPSVNDAATKSVSVATILTTAGWDDGSGGVASNGNPVMRQRIAVLGVNPDTNTAYDISPMVTLTQMEAYLDAMLVVSHKEDGYMTFKVLGDTPTVDIPIIILLLG